MDLNSKRVKKLARTGITSDRYQFLGLNQAEPDLGDPLVGVSSIVNKPIPAGDQYMVAAVDGYAGERYWIRATETQGAVIQGTQGLQGALSNF